LLESNASFDMLPFNTFSIHGLVGFTVTAVLSVVFFLSYWKLGRHALDLILSFLFVCVAAACMASFMADNVVMTGMDSWSRRDAAAATLQCIRFMYVMAIVSMPFQLHFVLCYCGVRSVLRRRIHWVYALFGVMIPVTWSPMFLQARHHALAAAGSWTCSAPWQPSTGPFAIVFLIIWIVVQVYSLVILHRGADSTDGAKLSRLALIRWAILIQAGGGLTAATAVQLGYAGPSLFSAGVVAGAVLIAIAITRDRIDVNRKKNLAEQELDLASRIQKQMLPQQDPSIPGFDASGWCRPAAKAGGDTYDFFPLPEGDWMVTLADASGHGIGPALIISETRAMLRAFGIKCVNAIDVLNEARKLLGPDLFDGQFVTCFLGLLDAPASALSYASAGHGPIIFYEQSSGRFHTERATHPPLPLVSPQEQDAPPALRRHEFQSGDFLVLVSDGIPESLNAKDEMFGLQGLLNVLQGARDLGAREMIDCCRREIDRFVTPAGQADDLTMAVLRKT
jgi:serine phosphatase RsbU (regulator of sigma subunit)